MNRLSIDRQADIAALIVEGCSLRSVSRRIGTLNTVLRNLVWIGEACQKFHDETVRDLKCSRVEADELWSFLYAKDKNLPEKLAGNRDVGDMYTWVSLDPDSKLVINWHIGKREFADAQRFAHDLASRVPNRVQITTDQLSHYRSAIEEAFGDRADYATIRKQMGPVPMTPDNKYAQPDLKVTRKASVMGNPDPELVTTTHIERFNLHIRTTNRRYARFTNAFGRSIRNSNAAFALHIVYHNFCRISPPIRVTPAMEAGLSDHIWEIEDLAALTQRYPTTEK